MVFHRLCFQRCSFYVVVVDVAELIVVAVARIIVVESVTKRVFKGIVVVALEAIDRLAVA